MRNEFTSRNTAGSAPCVSRSALAYRFELRELLPLLRTAALTLLLAVPIHAYAVEPDEVLADAQLEARARAISGSLRCPVCQNQSIDESNAPLARDLRLLVRERLQAGDSDAAVQQYIVRRYGDFVLLKPPVAGHTLLLWLAPAFLLLGAAGVLLWRARAARSAAGAASAELSPEEEMRLAKYLQVEGKTADRAARRSGHNG